MAILPGFLGPKSLESLKKLSELILYDRDFSDKEIINAKISSNRVIGKMDGMSGTNTASFLIELIQNLDN